MNKIVSIILLLFLFFNLNAKEKWKRIEQIQGVQNVIGGESISDFWYSDSLRNIVHYNNGQEEVYNIARINSYNSIRIIRSFYISNNRLIVIIIENDWTSHISEIYNGKIIKYHKTYDVPIKVVESIANSIYAFGDFGLILKLEDTEWVKVKSPIINSFIQVEQLVETEKLFLNVRNSGIWSFDGKEFKHYRFDSKKEELSSVIYMHFDSVYVQDYYGDLSKLVNGKFEKSNDPVSDMFSQILYNNSNELKVISKTGITNVIPLYFTVRRIMYVSDGHTLLLADNGYIYFNKEFNSNYFNNYASSMGVERMKYCSSSVISGNKQVMFGSNIVIADFNDDGLCDILSYMSYAQNKAILYTKTIDNVFYNTTNILSINNIKFNGVIFSATDLNKDGKIEIIATESPLKNKINIYYLNNNEYHINQSISLPDYCIANKSVSVSFMDFDKDGDVDILVTFGYSTNGKGGVLLYKNNGFGNFANADTSLIDILSGWNVASLVADLNNDNLNDILLSRSWSNNKILYQQQDNKWKEYIYNVNDSNVYHQRKSYSIAIDFDNDGDLDIFSIMGKPGIKVFENNSKGVFADITHDLGFDTLFCSNIVANIIASDFNNDGYIDLFIASSTADDGYNKILLNDSSFHFTDRSKQMEIDNHPLYQAISTDIDNDGDIDIFGIGKGNNYLWVNNLNDSNYLKISLKGIKSNGLGLGAKVWVYNSGYINDSSFLCAYQQLGSKQYASKKQSDLIMHFGLDINKSYDIKVKFYGGLTKELLNIKAGQTLNIVEIEGLSQYLYSFDNKIYNVLKNREFVIYLFTIIAGLFALSISIFFGNKMFNWNVKLTSIIISLDIILFTILLFTLYHIDSNNRYLIPLGFALLGSLGPLGVFIWIDKYNSLQSIEEVDGLLFQSLRSFSHGEWAASNLNSLQLLFENISVDDIGEDDNLLSFNKRRITFIEMTYPALEEITSLSSKLNVYIEMSEDLESQLVILYSFLKNDISNSTLLHKDEISKSIIKIRGYLSELKNTVFANHSCSPLSVYNNLADSIQLAVNKNNIHLVFKSFLNENHMVLMEANALADIVENCVHNSIKAMASVSDKELKIKLIKDDLRYLISITDNGCGVSSDNQDLIFENGFSTNESTGFGLAYAKDILSKYGGRIYLKCSNEWERTTFIIELQKNTSK